MAMPILGRNTHLYTIFKSMLILLKLNINPLKTLQFLLQNSSSTMVHTDFCIACIWSSISFRVVYVQFPLTGLMWNNKEIVKYSLGLCLEKTPLQFGFLIICFFFGFFEQLKVARNTDMLFNESIKNRSLNMISQLKDRYFTLHDFFLFYPLPQENQEKIVQCK